MKVVLNFIENESGVTAIEYGLIAALLTLVIIGAVAGIGGNIKETFKIICNTLNDVLTNVNGTAVACST